MPTWTAPGRGSLTSERGRGPGAAGLRADESRASAGRADPAAKAREVRPGWSARAASPPTQHHLGPRTGARDAADQGLLHARRRCAPDARVDGLAGSQGRAGKAMPRTPISGRPMSCAASLRWLGGRNFSSSSEGRHDPERHVRRGERAMPPVARRLEAPPEMLCSARLLTPWGGPCCCGLIRVIG